MGFFRRRRHAQDQWPAVTLTSPVIKNASFSGVVRDRAPGAFVRVGDLTIRNPVGDVSASKDEDGSYYINGWRVPDKIVRRGWVDMDELIDSGVLDRR